MTLFIACLVIYGLHLNEGLYLLAAALWLIRTFVFGADEANDFLWRVFCKISRA